MVKRHPIADSLGRTQDTRVLTEPDVMRLMMNSTLPAAESFEIRNPEGVQFLHPINGKPRHGAG